MSGLLDFRAWKYSFSRFLMSLIEWSIHGKLYFDLVIFVGINLSIATRTSDLKLTHISSTDIDYGQMKGTNP